MLSSRLLLEGSQWVLLWSILLLFWFLLTSMNKLYIVRDYLVEVAFERRAVIIERQSLHAREAESREARRQPLRDVILSLHNDVKHFPATWNCAKRPILATDKLFHSMCTSRFFDIPSLYHLGIGMQAYHDLPNWNMILKVTYYAEQFSFDFSSLFLVKTRQVPSGSVSKSLTRSSTP